MICRQPFALFDLFRTALHVQASSVSAANPASATLLRRLICPPSPLRPWKAFSVCREEPGFFDVCVKVYPNGRASGRLHRMQPGDTIDCMVWRKGFVI